MNRSVSLSRTAKLTNMADPMAPPVDPRQNTGRFPITLSWNLAATLVSDFVKCFESFGVGVKCLGAYGSVLEYIF